MNANVEQSQFMQHVHRRKIVAFIRFIVAILLLGPLLVLSCGYTNLSKQRRATEAVGKTAPTFTLDLNTPTADAPFTLKTADGRVMSREWLDNNLAFDWRQTYFTDKALGKLWETPDSRTLFKSAGNSKEGGGGYEAQYLHGKFVTNHRAYLILAALASAARARGRAVTMFPLIEMQIMDLNTLQQLQTPSERKNPWSLDREFPNAGFRPVESKFWQTSNRSFFYIVSMKLKSDNRSAKPQWNPIQDLFVNKEMTAPEASKDLLRYAEKVLRDSSSWLQNGPRTSKNALGDAELAQRIVDEFLAMPYKERRGYGYLYKREA